MCHQTLLTLFVLTELFLKMNELDPSIVGSWIADVRSLMVVTLPTDKVSRHQLMGLAGCFFFSKWHSCTYRLSRCRGYW